MAEAGREAEEAEAGREKVREEEEDVGREGCVVVVTPTSILFKGATSLSPTVRSKLGSDIYTLEGSKNKGRVTL